MSFSPVFFLSLSFLGLLAAGANVSFRYTTAPVAHGLWALSICLALLSIYKVARTLKSRERRIRFLKRRAKRISFSAQTFIIDRILDLRRPLHGLLGIHDLFSTDSTPAETKEYFEITQYCSRFLVRQLERVQFFIELENQSQNTKNTEFSLKQCVATAISQAEESLQIKDAHIAVDWSDEITDAVTGNEPAIKRILAELFDNAIKFAGCGVISLKIKPDPNNKAEICFLLNDTGPGLSASGLNFMNAPLPLQSRTTLWPESKSGLGLLIVKKILHTLAGRLYVESQRGLGTAFTFTFPEKILSRIDPSNVTNVINLEAARQRRAQKKAPASGYYIDFNSLYNSLDENMALCHEVLSQVSMALGTDLGRLAKALDRNEQNEILDILKKLQGEFTLVHCQYGIDMISKMSEAARATNPQDVQNKFEEMGTLFENILNEIEHLASSNSPAA